MKNFAAVLMLMFLFVGGACIAGACGMASHGSGSQESHAQDVKAPMAERPKADPNFDATRTLRMLEAYDRIVVALSNDKVSGVDEAAAIIVKEAPDGAIREAAAPLAAPDRKPDIAKLRERFKPLSTAVVRYVAGNHETLGAAVGKEKAVARQMAYCPMVEVAWLQPGGKITNPFYGSSMLRCGEFQDWADDD